MAKEFIRFQLRLSPPKDEKAAERKYWTGIKLSRHQLDRIYAGGQVTVGVRKAVIQPHNSDQLAEIRKTRLTIGQRTIEGQTRVFVGNKKDKRPVGWVVTQPKNSVSDLKREDFR